MEEKHDIKETKEALIGAIRLAECMIVLMKDGVDLTDAVKLYEKWQNDAVFKQAISDAASGIGKVSAEINDMSMAEGVELISVLIQEVPALLAAMKKEDPAPPADPAPEAA